MPGARERAPWWLRAAAPPSWWLATFTVGFVFGFVLLSMVGAPFWLPALLGVAAAAVSEWYWRRTRPPAADAPPSRLTQALSRRVRR